MGQTQTSLKGYLASQKLLEQTSTHIKAKDFLGSKGFQASWDVDEMRLLLSSNVQSPPTAVTSNPAGRLSNLQTQFLVSATSSAAYSRPEPIRTLTSTMRRPLMSAQ